METPSDLTWEDVFAVCKLMDVEYTWDDIDERGGMISPTFGIGCMFDTPIDALEHLSAMQEERNYINRAKILRTKP